MKFDRIDPPRVFAVGKDGAIHISDCGRLALEPDEQVTLTTPAGAEYDVARKSWGFYATPSTNGRLATFGLRAALARNAFGKYYVFLVERGTEDGFARYLAAERNDVVLWLDDEVALNRHFPTAAATAPVRVAALVQARMSSRRFPGKVLAPFRGIPIVDHVVATIRRALPDVPVAVLTSDETSDDPLADHLAARDVRCFRGPLADVLGRYCGYLRAYPAEWALRVTADSPLVNEAVLRLVVERLASAGDADMFTTTVRRTLPKGQNVELVRASVLAAIDASAEADAEDREHLTLFVHRHADRYRIVNVAVSRDFSDRSVVVDTIDDLRSLEALDDAAIDRYRCQAYWEDDAR